MDTPEIFFTHIDKINHNKFLSNKTLANTYNTYNNRLSLKTKLASRSLLGWYFGLYTFEQMQYKDMGKPYLKNYKEFNISHSGNYIILAVANTQIGCDIEIMKQINYHKLAIRYFTKDEQMQLRRSKNQLAEFFKIWSMKEAYIKRIGTGFWKERINTTQAQDVTQIFYKNTSLSIAYTGFNLQYANIYTINLN